MVKTFVGVVQSKIIICLTLVECNDFVTLELGGYLILFSLLCVFCPESPHLMVHTGENIFFTIITEREKREKGSMQKLNKEKKPNFKCGQWWVFQPENPMLYERHCCFVTKKRKSTGSNSRMKSLERRDRRRGCRKIECKKPYNKIPKQKFKNNILKLIFVVEKI